MKSHVTVKPCSVSRAAFLGLLLSASLFAFESHALPSSYTPLAITLDSSARHQTIEGFGTCTYLYDGGTLKAYATPAFQEMYARILATISLRPVD